VFTIRHTSNSGICYEHKKGEVVEEEEEDVK
jgi:hypothetical protein